MKNLKYLKLTLTLLALTLTVNLTGCATAFTAVAEFYDRQDPCQLRNNGGKFPDFCGAASGRTDIYDRRGNRIGWTKTNR